MTTTVAAPSSGVDYNFIFHVYSRHQCDPGSDNMSGYASLISNRYIESAMAKKTSKKVAFQPSGDRVLVKPLEAHDEKSPSGIIIPDTAQKEKPERGVIVSVGEGKRNEKGDILPMRYNVGDVVMFSKYGYDEIKIDDEEFYVLSESNILGVFK
jgi:chaperonin GroES